MKCDTCIVAATCTKKYYEKTLCEEMFIEIKQKIEMLREEAENLECEYGLQSYYIEKKE